MDRRIETRVVETGLAEKNTLIQKDACEVWWITVSNPSTNHAAVIKLYDGFDASGKLRWRLRSVPSGTHNFIPPIPCDQGIFVYNDTRVDSYTIAYRPKKWQKEAA